MSNESVLERIREIPDFPTLQRFASVLWKQDNSYHGASVMVGAGFSRCSATTGDIARKLPLWFNFSDILLKELDAKGTDPLRIAEEYTAYFGRQALNDLIKKEINDSAWEPGELHNSLLNLPWTEVLSTNWDTLLERASGNVHETFYSVVHRQEDLSHARSPRIVKLHGTLNVTNDLIFTQEDYRTYPEKHAAFVNFSRQVFIENELCLIGFSGDDPNFLQWIGWVRDHLATSARRIYLVGALGLNAAKRKYLESLNIAPIDLATLVSEYDDQDLKHKNATKLFLNALHELKPKPSWEWEPSWQLGNKSFEEKLTILKKDRENYPGWIICPNHLRFRIHSQINHTLENKVLVDGLSLGKRAELLYEISWRYNISFKVIPEWLAHEMLKISDPSTPNSLTKKQQLEITAYILKISRWYNEDDRKTCKKLAISIIENNYKYWPECLNFLVFHEVNEARRNLNYLELEDLLPKINATTPESKIKKATLCGELGLFEDGIEILSNTRSYLLDKYREDEHSVYLLSRLSLVDSLLTDMENKSSVRAFLSETARIRKCDLWPHIDNLKQRVQKTIETQENQQGIEVLFEPGTYKDNTAQQNFSNEVHPFIVFEEISSEVGIPVRWDNINYMIDVAKSLTRLDELSFQDRLYLVVLTVNSESDSTLEKTLSRIQLARVPDEECSRLIECFIQAIKFWLRKTSINSNVNSTQAVTKIRVFVEILARLSVRATSSQAKELFKLSMKWGNENIFRHLWLRKSLGHLIEYSLKTIPVTEQSDLLLDALMFPLASDIGGADASFQWPNPIIQGRFLRDESTEINHRIEQLIKSISPGEDTSKYALMRLIPLLDMDFLKEHEKILLCHQLWKDSGDKIKDFPKTGLLNWVLLKLPSKNPNSVQNKFREYVFNVENPDFLSDGSLLDLINSPNVEVYPSQNEALNCFNRLTSWRISKNKHHMFDSTSQQEASVGKYISEALARCIVPILSKDTLNQENYSKLREFIVANELNQVLVALPYFAQNNIELEGSIEKIIREHIHSSNKNNVTSAAFAIFEWRKLYKCESTDNLIATLITMITLNRESSAISVLNSINDLLLLEDGLQGDQVILLQEVIPSVFDNSNYTVESRTKNELANVSLLRSKVVKVAKSLLSVGNISNKKELKRVLSEAEVDPLPEVRHAATADIL